MTKTTTSHETPTVFFLNREQGDAPQKKIILESYATGCFQQTLMGSDGSFLQSKIMHALHGGYYPLEQEKYLLAQQAPPTINTIKGFLSELQSDQGIKEEKGVWRIHRAPQPSESCFLSRKNGETILNIEGIIIPQSDLQKVMDSLIFLEKPNLTGHWNTSAGEIKWQQEDQTLILQQRGISVSVHGIKGKTPQRSLRSLIYDACRKIPQPAPQLTALNSTSAEEQ